MGPRYSETRLAVRVEVVGESDHIVPEFPDAQRVDEVCRMGLKNNVRHQYRWARIASQGCPYRSNEWHAFVALMNYETDR